MNPLAGSAQDQWHWTRSTRCEAYSAANRDLGQLAGTSGDGNDLELAGGDFGYMPGQQVSNEDGLVCPGSVGSPRWHLGNEREYRSEVGR